MANKKSNKDINDISKLPPQSVEIENILLGQILIDSDSYEIIKDILRPEMFYKDYNSKIYQSIIDINELGFGINMMTVIDNLRKKGELDEIGGAYYITSLCNDISSSIHIKSHAHIIHQNWIKRHIAEKSFNLYSISFDQNSDVEDSKLLLDEIKQTVDFEVSNKSSNLFNETLVSIDEDIQNANFILKLHNSVDNKAYIFNIISENSASCIFGGAGSRKSTFISLISAVIASGENIGYLEATKAYKSIIFDTEQSPYYAQKVLKRAVDICGFEVIENLSLHCIKQYNHKVKKIIVEMVIQKTKPTVIFIDNIRDFVQDINNFKECAELTEWLRYLQDKYKLHTCLIIHRNKADDNARGHLGTEIKNMCETQIRIELDKENKLQSKITFEKLRDNFTPPDEILEVDENNIPSFVRGLSNSEANILFSETKSRYEKINPF